MVEQLIREPAGPAVLNEFSIIPLPGPVAKMATPPILKRKPLAIWTSLISAKVLTSHFEKNRGAFSPNDWEMMSFEDLGFLDRRHLAEYELNLVSVYDRDLFSNQARAALLRLALQKKHQNSTPLSIFCCGQSSSETSRNWRRVINELSRNCRIRVNYYKNEFCGTRISRLVSTW